MCPLNCYIHTYNQIYINHTNTKSSKKLCLILQKTETLHTHTHVCIYICGNTAYIWLHTYLLQYGIWNCVGLCHAIVLLHTCYMLHAISPQIMAFCFVFTLASQRFFVQSFQPNIRPATCQWNRRLLSCNQKTQTSQSTPSAAHTLMFSLIAAL